MDFSRYNRKIQINFLIFQITNGAVEEQRRMREYLRKMERDGVQRVKMFLIITAAYVLFWGPLFIVTLINHPIVGSNPLGHEVSTTSLLPNSSISEKCSFWPRVIITINLLGRLLLNYTNNIKQAKVIIFWTKKLECKPFIMFF